MNLVDLMALSKRQSLNATADSSESSPAPRETSIGKEDFLGMLLAQLENQDPLDPQDATEFTAQLATFSMLEQLVSIEQGIGDIKDLLSNATVVVDSAAPAAAKPT